MKFSHFFLLFLFISFHAQSNEQNNIRFIDLDYIFNNSDVGKKISKNAISSKKKIDEKNIKLEKNLEKQKNDILAKKNILEAKEFEKLVISHQKNVQEYQLDKGKSLKDLSTKNLEVTKNFMKKVDNILLQYASDNNIGIILNKNNLIVSNSTFDISKDILEIVNKKIKKID